MRAISGVMLGVLKLAGMHMDKSGRQVAWGICGSKTELGLLRASCLMLEINEFRCYEAKNRGKWKGRQPPGVEPRIVLESVKNWSVGMPGKFRNTKLVCTFCSPVHSSVQCPESSICTYPICNVATMSQPCKQADNMVVTKLSHLCCLGSCHLPVTTMLKTLLNLLTILIPGLWQLVITLLQLCNFNMNTASYLVASTLMYAHDSFWLTKQLFQG